jgi:putative hemolysin
MKKHILLLALCVVIAGSAGAVPNPSAVYCIKCGYQYQIRTDSTGGQYGVCVFPDGSECEAWTYYRKCNWPQNCSDCNCPWPCPTRIIYVDDDAEGANNGISWQDAYKYLQDALADANSAEKPLEIRVAKGVYKPDQGANQTPGDRKATFHLINGITLKGRYAGFGEPDPNARDTKLYESILSGDLADNDAAVDDPFKLQQHPSRADNSFRVVTATTTGPGTLLEGFVVTAALDQNPEDREYSGAGLYVGYEANITVQNCVFTANAAPGLRSAGSNSTFLDCVLAKNAAGWSGGGMYISGGSPRIIRCTFQNNWAFEGGGGLYNHGGRLWLESCTFTGNVACGLGWADTGFGGGLHSSASLAGSTIENCTFVGNIGSTGGGAHFGSIGMGPPPLGRDQKILLTGCTFIGNQASFGGAVDQLAATLDIGHSVFSENSALYTAGAISASQSITNLDHCIFSGNSASRTGACIFARGNRIFWGDLELPLEFVLTLNNCTIVRNSAPTGRALACKSSKSQDVDSTLISNCILDDGANEIHNPDGSHITIAYTDLRGGLSSIYDPCESTSWQQGNIDMDPCFVDPGYWDPNGTPDDASDDFWVDGDYHLKSLAGRWDPNNQSWVKDDVTSPCIDAGDPTSPIGYEPFPNGGRINMGAYGGTGEASKSYFGEPVCETIVAGDINGDCKVDFADFAIMALHWLEEH